VVRLAPEVGQRRGFTLVELLVVLAILVLLFGLLFAPMMTSLDMAREGQARAEMQNTARYAMEEVRRTIGNAVYVMPLDIVEPAADPTRAYANLSTITVASPRRNVSGVLMSPLQPETRPNAATGEAWLEAIRFTVHPRSGRIVRFDDDPATQALYPPGTTKSISLPSSGTMYAPVPEDPFVLYRQVGVWYLDPAVGKHRFGSFDSAGSFIPNEPISENALTFGDGYDVQCSASVCDNCGTRFAGFRSYDYPCLSCAAQTPGYTYLFDGVKFAPHRVAGEQLAKRPDGTVYSARQPAWVGSSYRDPDLPYDPCPQLSPRKLDPRVLVYRYDTSIPGYDTGNPEYDSYAAPPALRGNPQLTVSWSADAGAVKFGRFFRQIVTLTDTNGNVNVATQDDEATITPIRPVGSTVVPTGYRIEPDPAAVILPNSVKVRAVANLTGGGMRWFDLVQTDQYQQSQIGRWQFAVRRALPPSNWASWLPDEWATEMDILFSDRPVIGPPGVAKFAALGMNVDSVDVYIQYWARRNADLFSANPTARDDIVCVDYHTRGVLDVTLAVSEFVDYMEDIDGNKTVPAPPPYTEQAVLHDTVAVRNAGR
jgi:prepilin-type N-terminal cleavage/methylation domain-containing protein